MSDNAFDGLFTQPFLISKGPPSYPFKALGNVTDFVRVDQYKQHIASYRAAAPGLVNVDEPNLYLHAESNPVLTRTGLYLFERKWSTLPLPQTDYSSTAINKPAFPTNDFEGYWVDNITSGGTVTVWGISKAAVITSLPTGGTFTVTYKTQTTAALAWNASNATIESAVDGLSTVSSEGRTSGAVNNLGTSGSVWVQLSGTTLTGGTFTITPSLTPTCATTSSMSFNVVTLTARRTSINFQVTAHGLAIADTFAYAPSDVGLGEEGVVATVPDANNFTITNADSTWNFILSDFIRSIVRTYTPGPDRIRTQLITSFYLAGVSEGIASPSDIPIPNVATNDSELLLLICQNAIGFQIYDAESLAHWLESPIYMQTLINVDMSNF